MSKSLLAGLLLTVAAFSTASAGVPDDIIAFYLGGGNVAQGQLMLKAKGPTVQTLQFQSDLLTATKAALANPNVLGTANKTTPSAIVAIATKRIPQFSPDLAQAGVTAALASPTLYKLTTTAAQVLDSNKVGANTLGAGTKSFPKGTQNTPAYTLAPANIPNIASAITALGVTAANANVALAASAVPSLAGQYIKTAITLQKLNDYAIDGAMTGFVAQVAGVDNAAFGNNTLMHAVTVSAVQAGIKYVNKVVTSITAAFTETYLFTHGPGPISSTAFVSANLVDILDAVSDAMGTKFTAKASIAATQAIYDGVSRAYSLPATIPGQLGINGFAFNNGTGTPVTNVTDLNP